MTDSFAEVKKALEKIPPDLQRKVMVGATRAAATVIAKEARKNAPVRTGLLKKSIAVRMVPKSKTPAGKVNFYVVPLTKTKFTASIKVNGKAAKLKATRTAYYAHMVEFGTVKMAPHPYLRPAYESSAETSVRAFQQYALKRVDKEIAKLAVR